MGQLQSASCCLALAAGELHKVQFGPKKLPGLIGGQVGMPGLILVQEWWGLTPQIEAHALKMVEAGYRVLVPDIYKGKVGVDAEEAHHLMSELDFPGAVAEISAAAAFLKQEGSVKVGIMGFCMGGALTLGALAKSPDLAAGVPFYGVNFQLFDPADFAGKAIQAHFGMEDKFEGFADKATADKLMKAIPDAEVFVYPKVGHAFMNDKPQPFASFEERQAKMGFPPYDRDIADLAWSRLLVFFDKHLRHSTKLSEL